MIFDLSSDVLVMNARFLFHKRLRSAHQAAIGSWQTRVDHGAEPLPLRVVGLTLVPGAAQAIYRQMLLCSIEPLDLLGIAPAGRLADRVRASTLACKGLGCVVQKAGKPVIQPQGVLHDKHRNP
nr:hypothetical protein [Comamonas koreensis]